MEDWRAIPGWDGFYEVSATGRVRSVERTVRFSDGRLRSYPAKERATHTDGFGYRKVTLKRQGVNQRALVHHLVALAWIGPRPPGLDVCHWDGDKTNNGLQNLRYDTRSANHADAVRHGTAKRKRKYSDQDVEEVRALRGFFPLGDVAEAYGMSKTHVCNVQRGNRRTL